MRVILTGATSFIGSVAAKCLEAHGHEVVRLRHSFDEEADRLPDRADVWLHFAWGGHGSAGRSDPAIQEHNVDMSLAAIEKAAGLGCKRFVFAGSQAEYGHAQDGRDKSEDGACEPVSEYGKAKLKVCLEAAKHKGDMSYVHMRIFSVYGPGDHAASLIDSLISGFSCGETVELGNCTQSWNYMYISDAAEAIGLLCERAEDGIYNVGSADTRKLRDYVEELHKLMGGKGSTAFGVRPDNAEGPADLSPDISKLESLGFCCKYSFADGIGEILKTL